MDKLNHSGKVDSQITSRYTIVIAAAKRARQIIDGANPLIYASSDRAVSIAIEEMEKDKILIRTDPTRLQNSDKPVRQASAFFQGIIQKDIKSDREDGQKPYEDDISDEEDDGYKSPRFKDANYDDYDGDDKELYDEEDGVGIVLDDDDDEDEDDDFSDIDEAIGFNEDDFTDDEGNVR
jgi:DNA-directed RNA polymerase subunit omega